MKKFILLILGICACSMLGGCGNSTFIDTNYTYDYAILQLQDGTIVEGEVERWCDYEGEQLQVTIDGDVYLTNSVNCTLINYANVKTEER